MHMGAASGLNWSANISKTFSSHHRFRYHSSSKPTTTILRKATSWLLLWADNNRSISHVVRPKCRSTTASSSQDLTSWSADDKWTSSSSPVDVAPPHWIGIIMSTKNNLQESTAFCFCFCFYHIFSNTPSLMLSIMLVADAMNRRLRLVSPVHVPKPEEEEEEDDHYRLRPDYVRTELTYQAALEEDPHNTIYLSNYAQFLYVVAKDHHRADHYFRRAVDAEADAECLSRYADFLWLANNDFTAAEETYLKAVSTDPENMSLAAKYAHFLWSTGGDDTCFPLSQCVNE